MKQLKTIIAFFGLFLIIINTFTISRAQTGDELNNYNESPSRLRGVIEKFSEDYGSLNRFYTAQLYNLHRELVDSKKMTNRNFHDAILKEGAIPVEMVRAILTKQKLTRDFKPNRRFYQGLGK